MCRLDLFNKLRHKSLYQRKAKNQNYRSIEMIFIGSATRSGTPNWITG